MRAGLVPGREIVDNKRAHLYPRHPRPFRSDVLFCARFSRAVYLDGIPGAREADTPRCVSRALGVEKPRARARTSRVTLEDKRPDASDRR